MSDLIHNRKASFDYIFLDEYEAGIELLGFEVKALRQSRASLEGSHVIVRGKEVYLIGMKIDPYQVANTPESYESTRTRKLLLHKKEIAVLEKKSESKGLTIIPISVYTKGPKIKLRIAIARGKKLYDKRETIKKRDVDRELRREMRDH